MDLSNSLKAGCLKVLFSCMHCTAGEGEKTFRETYEENLLHITKQNSFWKSFLSFMHSSMLSLQPLSDLDGPVWMVVWFHFKVNWADTVKQCSAHFRCTFTTASDKSVQIFKSVRLSSSTSAKHSFLNECPFFASHYVLCTVVCMYVREENLCYSNCKAIT